MDLESLFSAHREKEIKGRYLALKHLEPFLSKYSSSILHEVKGYSEEGRKIYSIKTGTGDFKILMWSQMHGNESTTTKAICDLINFLAADGKQQAKLLKRFTFLIIPMLNPDGALLYTRVNANGVDLNRDARTQTQKETRTLIQVYNDFQPDLCLNMHDQRSLFSVGNTNKPAVVSFLAPSADENKTITTARKFAMEAIVAMQQRLNLFIPGHISRFEDTFNQDCVGDTFQSLKTPTILFEAGHVSADYEREETRMYIFYALLSLLDYLFSPKLTPVNHEDYFLIPENKKNFRDIIITNASIPDLNETVSIGIQYKEVLVDDEIAFIPQIDFIEKETSFFGHKTINASGGSVVINNETTVFEGQKINQLKINNKKISFN